jgi:hypothetical protein
MAADGRLMVTETRTSPAFKAGPARLLFRTRASFPSSFAVSDDGQRFLIVSADEQATTRPATVVVNWAAALSR